MKNEVVNLNQNYQIWPILMSTITDHQSMKKHSILNRLHKNNIIVILRPDKGHGVVIIDRDVYIQKTFEIIKDCTKFKELSRDPTTIREGF